MKSGIIKLYRYSEGWAIIAPDEPGPDVFLHFSDIVDPKVKERMCTGLPVLFDIEKGPKGWIAVNCKSEISFTWMDLPGELCAGNVVAVRDERDGTTEIFDDKVKARGWIKERKAFLVQS